MKLVWDESARREFVEAAGYYGSIDPDLGERFIGEVAAAVVKIRSSPLLYRKFDGQARKTRVVRFPYAIVFWIEDETIHIVAAMHLHREPGYWRRRLNP